MMWSPAHVKPVVTPNRATLVHFGGLSGEFGRAKRTQITLNFRSSDKIQFFFLAHVRQSFLIAVDMFL